MAVDLFDFALDNLKDGFLFEKLAIEVMAIEQYPGIKKIGGIHDEGKDAEELIHEIHPKKIVFQFTIQKDLQSKIQNTISKLDKNGISYHELIFVTSREVDNISEIIRKYKKDKGIVIDIYDRQTFNKHFVLDRLLFKRYFDGIESQLTEFINNSEIQLYDQSSQTEKSLLKSALLFTFHDKTPETKKRIFDQTILSFIIDNGENSTIESILKTFNLTYSTKIDLEELKASLSRLVKKGYIRLSGNVIEFDNKTAKNIALQINEIVTSTERVLDGLVAKVALGEGAEYKPTIKSNVKKCFEAYFQKNAFEIVSEAIDGVEKVINDESIFKLAAKNLPARISEKLIAIIGETISNPTEEQAKVLTGWARSVIGYRIMGLDPKLNLLHKEKLSSKIFILDTDFFLKCLVLECPESRLYNKIITSLLRGKARVIIPEYVIFEAMTHLEHAYNNFTFFRDHFNNVDDEILKEQIRNVFVLGFLYSKYRRYSDLSHGFNLYLANYTHQDAQYMYFKDMIGSEMPKGIEVLQIDSIIKDTAVINKSDFDKLTTLILDIIKQTVKAKHRTDEGNRKLAENDAKAFLITYNCNIVNGNAFVKRTYLVSSSLRAQNSAKKLGYEHNVIIKPHTLSELSIRFGDMSFSDKEYVKIMDNPFLMKAVDDSWDGIKTMASIGVDLSGKSLTKLRYDYEEKFCQYIIRENNLDRIDENRYDNFVSTVKSEGYNLVPIAEVEKRRADELQKDLTEKDEKILNLEKEKEIVMNSFKDFKRKKEFYLVSQKSKKKVKRKKR